MQNINNFSSTPYQYDYINSGNHITNNFHLQQNKTQMYYMNTHKMPSSNTTGKLPYEVQSNKFKFSTKMTNIGKNILKGIRPGQLIMMGVMAFAIFARNGITTTPTNTESNRNIIEQAYKMGEQHIRDSLKNAELENELQIAKSTLKTIKRLPK